MEKKNPEFYYSTVFDHSYKISFHDYDDVNGDLSLALKRTALQVSPCVVGISVYSGEDELFFGSGTIYECEFVDGAYSGTVISSATLIRSRSSSNKSDVAVADNLKVTVHSRGGEVFESQIMGYNLPYNILVIKIKSQTPLPTACIREVDDSFRPKPQAFELRSHSNNYKISLGEVMMPLGRSYTENHSLMATSGKFSIEYSLLYCKELLRVNCRISQAGIGGPMLNGDGDVLGMNFYYPYYTPFLPTNVILKYLDHLKRNLSFDRPKLVMQAASLYTSSAMVLEKFIQKFPDISSGVIVENLDDEDEDNEKFDLPGVLVEDVIVKCAGVRVYSLLELLDIAREKVGEYVDLEVARSSEGVCFTVSVVLAKKISTKVDCWKIPRNSIRKKLEWL